MKNYLSKHYDHYYIMTENGQTNETTRAECLARVKNRRQRIRTSKGGILTPKVDT